MQQERNPPFPKVAPDCHFKINVVLTRVGDYSYTCVKYIKLFLV